MELLPALASWPYAAAGATCAVGLVILHWLTRRRHRRLDWAAMELLRRALARQQTRVRLRDLLLLALRVTVLLMFGLALSQPFFSSAGSASRQPCHAIIVIDNSLSMSYTSLNASRLKRATQEAMKIIERQPRGSRFTLIAACGPASASQFQVHDTPLAAAAALNEIRVVDRELTQPSLIDVIRNAPASPVGVPRHIYLLTDCQMSEWSSATRNDHRESERPKVFVVCTAATDWENSWIVSLSVPDQFLSASESTAVLAEISHHGPPRNTTVQLEVAGELVDSQPIALNESTLPQLVTFDCPPMSGRTETANYVPVRVSMNPDRLPMDDERVSIVPLGSGLPVVLVDTSGKSDVAALRKKETTPVRRLLAPKGADTELFDLRHPSINDLDRKQLADARLVVIAGLRDPIAAVDLLHEYVSQGGQLLIAAGSGFDAAKWSESAWLNGGGILPGPITNTIGYLPGATTTRPFSIDFETVSAHALVQLPGMNERQLRDIYSEPLFFQAVCVTLDPLAGAPSPTNRPDTAQHGTAELRWLNWQSLDTSDDSSLPTVLARFDDEAGTPFLIEHRIGRGRVVFITTGLLLEWNTWANSNAVLILDHLLRSLIVSTLPDYNFDPREDLAVPIRRVTAASRFHMIRPEAVESSEPLEVRQTASGVGVVIDHALQRGLYQIRDASSGGVNDKSVQSSKADDALFLAVNGTSRESDLTLLQASDLPQFAELELVHLSSPDQLKGRWTGHRGIWQSLVLSILALLACESMILSYSRLRTG